MEPWEKLGNLQTPYFASKIGGLEVSPEALFNWKLLQIGLPSDKGMGKNYFIFEVGVASHAPPPPLEIEILHISDFELSLRIPQH